MVDMVYKNWVNNYTYYNYYYIWFIPILTWFMVQITPISLSHMLHVWYIYLQRWVIFGANAGVHIQAPGFAYGYGLW